LLPKDTLECYIKAGKIAAETRKEIRNTIKEGVPIIEICQKVEDTIRRKGGSLAFPCNLCVNDVAAHYSSPPRDIKTIPKEALVKVDLGAHVNGYIADTAFTVSLTPEYDSLIYAVNEALKQAIRIIKPGIKTDQIGKTIQSVIERYGFKPIRNLTGHQMSRYVLHTGKSIPNVPKYDFSRLKVDDVFAVEPFLTLSSGDGNVRASNEQYIYRLQKEKNVNSTAAKQLLKTIKEKFRSLPFSKRWLNGMLPKDQISKAFNELLLRKNISSYPVLVEKRGKIVAQAEHTVIVTKKGCLITTQ
jgi:methionyl aminopeptidase